MYKKIQTIEELEEHLSKYSEGYLFRGQVKHYVDSAGDINIPTSFSRHGCIPDFMFKWTHYAKAMLRAFTGGSYKYFDIDMEMSQAILQHYGWRSFYVDLSKSAAISCWFASNAYSESHSLHISENINENPVWLRHKDVKYTEHEGSGNLYIIDQSVLNALDIKVHDLTTMQGDEGRLRFHVQQACLAGSLKANLPAQSIAAHLEVPVSVLRAYCKKHRVCSLSDVFPSKEEDFLLNMLLSLPWEKIQVDDSPIPLFRRGLEIPDYEENFIKHLPPSVTLYERYWIADHRENLEIALKNTVYFKLPEIAYYANTNEPFTLLHVNEVLDAHGSFVIELDGLIKVVEDDRPYHFEKGIHVSRDEGNNIWVSGLLILHPSNIVKAVGKNEGWSYQKNDTFWKRINHKDQCPCNNDLRHELQFALLRHLEEAFLNDQLVNESDLCFRHKEIPYH